MYARETREGQGAGSIPEIKEQYVAPLSGLQHWIRNLPDDMINKPDESITIIHPFYKAQYIYIHESLNSRSLNTCSCS